MIGVCFEWVCLVTSINIYLKFIGFKILDEGDRELPIDNAVVSKLKVSNTTV